MKNKSSARNRAHLHIMNMMCAKIENLWHKKLVNRADVQNFFRPLNAKFADAKVKKMKKKVADQATFFVFKLYVQFA